MPRARADAIELRVHPGADGRFELYENEGEGYADEKGVSAPIPLEWSEARRALTFGPRRGSFPGMLESRHLQVVCLTATPLRSRWVATRLWG